MKKSTDKIADVIKLKSEKPACDSLNRLVKAGRYFDNLVKKVLSPGEAIISWPLTKSTVNAWSSTSTIDLSAATDHSISVGSSKISER